MIDVEPSSKICTQCGEDKPLSEYYKAKYGKYGKQAKCISCKDINRKIHYKENKEDILKKCAERYKKSNEDKYKKWREDERFELEAYKNGYLKCKKCYKFKPYVNFHNDSSRRFKRYPYCKSCDKKLTKDWYENISEEKREEISKWKKDYYQDNKEYIKVSRREYNREYVRNRINTDPLYKLKYRCRKLIKEAYNKKKFRKGSKTHEWT